MIIWKITCKFGNAISTTFDFLHPYSPNGSVKILQSIVILQKWVVDERIWEEIIDNFKNAQHLLASFWH